MYIKMFLLCSNNLYINSDMILFKIVLLILVCYVETFDMSFFHPPTRQWIITARPNAGGPQHQQYTPACFSSSDWINCLTKEKDFKITTPLQNTMMDLRYKQNMQTRNGIYRKFPSIPSYFNNLLQGIHPSSISKKIIIGPKDNLPLSLPKSNLTFIPNIYKKTANPVNTVSKSDKITNSVIAQSTTPQITIINTIEENKVSSVFVPTTKDYKNFTHFELNVNEVQRNNMSLIEKFKKALDKMERTFYMATFTKLTSSLGHGQWQGNAKDNAISFIQSGLFLQIFLLAVSTQVDYETRAEINECIGFNVSDKDTAKIINEVITDLPKSNNDLVLRWSSRLVVAPSVKISQEFTNGDASALHLHIDYFNGTESSEKRADVLNKKIEQDSNGAIRNTFEADDLSGTVSAVMLTTLYLRARWRSAPTVLNGTRPFRDAYDAPQRTVRMIRINDIMRYADMTDIDAEAIEVFYATPGLSLLILVPRGQSLTNLISYVCDVGLHMIIGRMSKKRLAATLPIYTLRMTLLLPSKLQVMGISRLLNVSDETSNQLRVSHGVQRIMFWAEAGRNAFKDDGFEWDESPELEVIVDRPYIFFVRWHNMTLMNGNFVL